VVAGEPLPIEKVTGDRLTGGTISGNRALVMRAERVGADTRWHRAFAWSPEVQRRRPDSAPWQTESRAWFVPAVVGVAIVAFVVWSIWVQSLAWPWR
jgi:Cu+-exporting ATPase